MKSFRLCGVIISIPMALLISNVCAASVATFAETQRNFQSSEAVLQDRNGVLLHALRRDPKVRRLAWVKLEEVSPALRNALINTEDKHFYEHGGVDWNAVAAAAWNNLNHKQTRGASTITMQLAGLLDADLQRKAGPRSGAQKISQVLVAQSLERTWRKEQILEAYLNLVSFRGELVGVDALARVLFGKHPSGLNKRESAIAVALIRAPNASPKKVAERACVILKSQQAASACANLDGVTDLLLARLGSKAIGGSASSAPQLAPHLAHKLLKNPGQALRSTLDIRVQSFARDALQRQLAALVDRNIEDGAVLVLDNATGEVLAWVGSSGEFSSAAQVDGVLALRQAGSTLKPFLYEMALEQKWITAASILDDSALNLPTAAGLYIPQNYDKHFKGLVSVRTALGSSLNIPAVRTLMTVTPERFFQRLQTLGFQLRESGDYYGYSLALGSADVNLLALTNAYRTLANQGRSSPVRFVPNLNAASQPAEALTKTVMTPAAAYIVGDILSDRSARARTFGLENALSTRIWTAVKTGTSKDMRDNWCLGYSARYTVGVWVGNASGQPMWDVSGVTGAAPIWQEVMQFLHDKIAPAGALAPLPPTGLVAQAIRYEAQLEAPRKEWFLTDTAQSLIALAQPDHIKPAIRYPTQGMLIALDPDIPAARQRMRFAAQGLLRGGWVLDGKPLGKALAKVQADLAQDWMPWPGKHALMLVDAKGAVLDQVKFEVLGAFEKPAVHRQRVGKQSPANERF